MNESVNEKVGRKVSGKLVNRLVAVDLDRLPAPGLYPDGNGLYLQVTSKTARSWVYRYRAGNKVRGLGLGPLRLFPLAVARQMAADAARLRRQGLDPIETRKSNRAQAQASQAQRITFSEACEAYIASHKDGWKNAKHADQWRSTLETYAKPYTADLDVAAIDTAKMIEILKPIWKTKPETAGRIRGRIELVLNYAKAMGHRAGDNPARWRGHLDQLLPARGKVARVVHHAALDWRQAPAFYQALCLQNGVAAMAFRFAILTAARTGEVIYAAWPEIDLENALWTVPATRMKSSKIHRVPLAVEALAVLRHMKTKTGGTGFVFPGQKPRSALSNMTMLAVLKRMARTDLTVHGFRSTFRDWATEATAFPSEAIELALAHTIASKVEAAYRRGDMLEKRRDLAQTWADYLTKTEKTESSERRSQPGDAR